MKLAGIAWRGYGLPFRHRYVTSRSQANTRFGIIVSLKTDVGFTGIGEASPLGPSNALEIGTTARILEKLSPGLLGRDTSTAEESLLSGDVPPHLRFGLETALLDIAGQAAGCSITTLLGGSPASLAVNAIISTDSPEQAIAEAREAIESGFTCLKLKVGSGTPDEDETLVAAVRRAAGSEAHLRLDPNQAWQVSEAIASLRRLARYGIEYVEQPVSAADITGLAEVRRSVTIPIAADESLGSMEDMRRLLDAGGADIFIFKPARLGGLTTSLALANTALAAGHSVVVTTGLESSIGTAACAHLAAALPSSRLTHGLATGLLFSDDLTSEPLLPVHGKLQSPSHPGLGVKINAAALRKYDIGIIGSVGSRSAIAD